MINLSSNKYLEPPRKYKTRTFGDVVAVYINSNKILFDKKWWEMIKWTTISVNNINQVILGCGSIKKENGKRKSVTILAHRFITSAPKGMDVDHKNNNRLDNTEENLRVCTHAENCLNIPGKNKGVRKIKGKWKARITFKRKEYSLGTYRTKKEAIAARDEAAKKLHKEFANLNSRDNLGKHFEIKKHPTSSTSPGVSWCKRNKRWICRYYLPLGESIYLGSFKTEKEASARYYAYISDNNLPKNRVKKSDIYENN